MRPAATPVVLAILWVCLTAASPGPRQAGLLSVDEALPRDGRPALLAFFATGCPPCADDLLETAAFVRRNGLAVAVIGVCGDTERDIRAFVEKHSLACPVVRDERGRVRRRFGVGLLPMKIVLVAGKEVYRDDDRLPLDERRRRAERCLAGLMRHSRSGSRS
jgi:hypothetical protein